MYDHAIGSLRPVPHLNRLSSRVFQTHRMRRTQECVLLRRNTPLSEFLARVVDQSQSVSRARGHRQIAFPSAGLKRDPVCRKRSIVERGLFAVLFTSMAGIALEFQR